MGEAKRNRYTKEFKFKVALAAIKGEKQLSELAAEYKVHQTLISTWKRKLMEQGAGIFETRPTKSEAQAEAIKEDLVKTIGHQTIQIDWLKKSWEYQSRGKARHDKP
ncbi:MAG: transposase [Candidatus Altiarchaeota archaeon]|nr:transposase [Candidatus Altiarchaeota archaeon]